VPLSYTGTKEADFMCNSGQIENKGQADSIRQLNNTGRLTFRLAAHIVQEDRKIKGDRKTQAKKSTL
jgi:hypothetical protein